MKKAVFFDRDGVIIEDINLLYKKEQIVVIPEALKVLEELRKRGYFLSVVTNQSVVSRGMVSERGLEEINLCINELLGHSIDAFYYCPHHPNANLLEYRKNCDCRKPAPGLILRAAKENNIKLKDSWMIGDKLSDIQAGKLAGCRTILIESPKNNEIGESAMKLYEDITPHFKIKNITEVLEYVK